MGNLTASPYHLTSVEHESPRNRRWLVVSGHLENHKQVAIAAETSASAKSCQQRVKATAPLSWLRSAIPIRCLLFAFSDVLLPIAVLLYLTLNHSAVPRNSS